MTKPIIIFVSNIWLSIDGSTSGGSRVSSAGSSSHYSSCADPYIDHCGQVDESQARHTNVDDSDTSHSGSAVCGCYGVQWLC